MNVSELISSYLTEKNQAEAETRMPERLHVADVANGCTRAVWHRIHNGLKKAFTANDLKKFQYGHAWETVVKLALINAGYDVIADELIEIEGVVGHPDILAVNKDERHLIEVKTTMLFRNGNKPPTMYTYEELREKQGHYIVQACLYAKYYDCEKFTVHLSDRGTGIDGDFEFITKEEWGWVESRLLAVKIITASTGEPEPILPEWTRNPKGVSYLCRGCPVLTCSQNPAYTAKES